MAARRRAVAWTDSARAALDEVITFIARESREGAIQVLERALDTAESLDTLADRGRIVPELGDPAVRELFVHRYRMLYRVLEDRIVIEAFLHGARDFATWRHGQTES